MALSRRRTMRGASLIACIALACAVASGEWAVLKDGRAVRVLQREGDITLVKYADGTTASIKPSTIARVLSDRAFDREVDSLTFALGRSDSRARAQERLEKLGPAAVRQLVFRVKGPDKVRRMMALAALQFCWSPEARHAVLAATKDRDSQVRRMATFVARRHLPAKDLAGVLKSQVHDRDPKVAGAAIAAAEADAPDADRMGVLMARTDLWPYIHRWLRRYHDPRLGPQTFRMLDRGTTDQRVSAIASLIHQQDDSPKIRARIMRLLYTRHVDLRDMVAEYMRWHGTAGEREALAARLKIERDVQCRASLAAAIDAIDRRAKRFKPGGEASGSPWPTKPADAYEAAFKALTATPDAATRKRVVALLARAELFEPIYRYGITKRPADQSRRGSPRDAALMRLMNLAFGYPPVPNTPIGGGDVKLPPAASLIGPVRRYTDPSRKSFGNEIPAGEGPFAGTVHVGDDVSWGKSHATVVAIGDGVVRYVGIGVVTWGGIVIVEHAGADGVRFCSLYAHLGPLVCVRPGQVVTQGQKLGAIGRSFTWSGGGYRAHLHFGIHTGPFSGGLRVGEVITVRTHEGLAKATVTASDEKIATLKVDGLDQPLRMPQPAHPAWITGYMGPAEFKADKHGWVEPQQFIRTRRERPKEGA